MTYYAAKSRPPSARAVRDEQLKAEILEHRILIGLLGSELIGFQQQLSVRNFLSLAHQRLGLETDANSIHVDGRQVTVDCLPMSVDTRALERVAAAPAIRRRTRRSRLMTSGAR